jgi:hypothetical protein
MVNRIDRLALKLIDKQLFFSSCVQNRFMKSYIIRIECKCSKITLQVFSTSWVAICFSCKLSSSDISDVYSLLPSTCGIQVLSSSIASSVWVYQAISPIGDLRKFLKFCLSVYPCLLYNFEPELFPLLTLRFLKQDSSKRFVTARLSHRGKIVFLGVQHVCELAEPIHKLSSLIFDFCLANSFCNM